MFKNIFVLNVKNEVFYINNNELTDVNKTFYSTYKSINKN